MLKRLLRLLLLLLLPVHLTILKTGRSGLKGHDQVSSLGLWSLAAHPLHSTYSLLCHLRGGFGRRERGGGGCCFYLVLVFCLDPAAQPFCSADAAVCARFTLIVSCVRFSLVRHGRWWEYGFSLSLSLSLVSTPFSFFFVGFSYLSPMPLLHSPFYDGPGRLDPARQPNRHTLSFIIGFNLIFATSSAWIYRFDFHIRPPNSDRLLLPFQTINPTILLILFLSLSLCIPQLLLTLHGRERSTKSRFLFYDHHRLLGVSSISVAPVSYHFSHPSNYVSLFLSLFHTHRLCFRLVHQSIRPRFAV